MPARIMAFMLIRRHISAISQQWFSAAGREKFI